MFKKSTAVMLLFSLTAVTAHAGGLLTNTNQNISFNRNFAREGTIGIDGVYSNPAGVSFLTKGFHLSLNVQNVYQTRDITSSITVPTLQGTPFYQPFKLNGGDDNGEKFFRGKASVPVLPSFQAAMVYDKWTLPGRIRARRRWRKGYLQQRTAKFREADIARSGNPLRSGTDIADTILQCAQQHQGPAVRLRTAARCVV